MKVIKIEKSDLAAGLDKLRGGYRLFGPVKDKTSHGFQELAAGQAPDLAFQNTRLSPKNLVFPQSETLLAYSLDGNDPEGHIAREVDKDYSPRAVIGIRPCDAKALTLVKMNFDTDAFKDPYWLNLYNASTFVGLACDAPGGTCFCTTTGSGPFHEEGLDVLLVDQHDHFLAKVLTDKGEKLMTAAGFNQSADGDAAVEKAKTAAEAAITTAIVTDSLAAADPMALYNADIWEDIAFACINCGTCTFSCPTCWCFDIQDEAQGNKGVRMRNWDSCMFPLFTMHTTGHNPRDTKVKRTRQRFMHKLKYFVDKYNAGIMCVGCGRCVRQCPVNIDIRKVSALMNNVGDAAKCAV
ncbi:MAG: 4Fe-4S dicluster domain-containing protein [Desulfatitalea sp.]|nr:4Fe-4S dicluster domain-containing protein [Desulfatitalea sp.]NNJ99606.1 4Fe-4S dicluster domain-containing protein [Desulfatitalea sp.]